MDFTLLGYGVVIAVGAMLSLEGRCVVEHTSLTASKRLLPDACQSITEPSNSSPSTLPSSMDD